MPIIRITLKALLPVTALWIAYQVDSATITPSTDSWPPYIAACIISYLILMMIEIFECRRRPVHEAYAGLYESWQFGLNAVFYISILGMFAWSLDLVTRPNLVLMPMEQWRVIPIQCALVTTFVWAVVVYILDRTHEPQESMIFVE